LVRLGEERLHFAFLPIVREEILVKEVQADSLDGPRDGRERVERRDLAPEPTTLVERFGARKLARGFVVGTAVKERERGDRRGKRADDVRDGAMHAVRGLVCHESWPLIT